MLSWNFSKRHDVGALDDDLGPSATDLHMLAVLQHHGVPTRLIDVTSNPMTALWFAVEEHWPREAGEPRRSPGVLFAIDVSKTPWYETFQHGEGQTSDHLVSPLAATYKQASRNQQQTSRCSEHSQHFLTSA